MRFIKSAFIAVLVKFTLRVDNDILSVFNDDDFSISEGLCVVNAGMMASKPGGHAFVEQTCWWRKFAKDLR